MGACQFRCSTENKALLKIKPKMLDLFLEGVTISLVRQYFDC